MARSRKWNQHSEKDQHSKDEPFSSEDNKDAFVSNKKINMWAWIKEVGKSRKRKINSPKIVEQQYFHGL